MRIEITKEDIRLGVRDDPCRCALALAFKRELPSSRIHVGTDTVLIDPVYVKGTKVPIRARRIVDLPPIAQRGVGLFDGKRGLTTFGFDIEL